MIDRRTFLCSTACSFLAAALGAEAQQPKTVWRLGFLSTRSASESAAAVAAFQRGLNERGYAEGQNVAIEYRWADNQYDRLPALAADLVRRQVAVIATGGGPTSALAAKAATTTIPIVFVSGDNPVKYGLVASFNAPGGNLTGISFLATALVAKQFELLRELVPPAKLIAFLANPTNPETGGLTRDVQDAAKTAGQQIMILSATSEGELESAFANIVERRASAVLVATDPFFLSHRNQIVALAARHRLPTGFAWREAVVAGGLMSYGASILDAYRLAGIYTGRILKGARPADLPVIQPTKFELVLNLKTAKAFGLTIPQSLLLQADEVIQ